MNVRNAQNLSMLCDFYELTMSNGYFRNGYKDRITYFDLFFRQVPDGGGFAIDVFQQVRINAHGNNFFFRLPSNKFWHTVTASLY